MAATNMMESVLRLCLSSFLLIVCLSDASEVVMEDVVPASANLMSNIGYRIDGRVEILTSLDKDWMPYVRVLVDGGDYLSYLRPDGSFSIGGIPSGSYVVEITHPGYLFEPARVDINSKGKIRARRVNNLQPASVKTMTYPLEFRERGRATYFQIREQWRITDFLFNPMVLTMILPLLVIMVLPKMMNAADPDTQREVQTQMNALNAKQSLPDLSEFFTSLFSDGKKPTKKSSKKR